MLRNRWAVFAIQFVLVAVIWGLFLALLAKHPLDGWFPVQVIGVALAVALVGLWRTSRANRPQGRS
jgi:RsiW-degrading membrane proteinase PrsW (M82 family)